MEGTGFGGIKLGVEEGAGFVGFLVVFVEVDEGGEDGAGVREVFVGAFEGFDGGVPSGGVAGGVLVKEVGVVDVGVEVVGVLLGVVPEGAGGGGEVVGRELRGGGLPGEVVGVGGVGEGGFVEFAGSLVILVLLGIDSFRKLGEFGALVLRVERGGQDEEKEEAHGGRGGLYGREHPISNKECPMTKGDGFGGIAGGEGGGATETTKLCRYGGEGQ